jgi:hypothetical protein
VKHFRVHRKETRDSAELTISLLKGEEDGDRGFPLLYEGPERVGEEETINDEQECHEGDDPDMREQGNGGRGLDVLDPLLGEPVQGLDEEKRCDHGKECDGEVLAEDGDGEEDLDDLPPGLLVEALDLGLPERAEEDALDELPGGAHGDEARVEEQHEADLGVGEVDHRRVELLPAAEGVVHRGHRRQQAERRVRLQPDHLRRRGESPAPKISPTSAGSPANTRNSKSASDLSGTDDHLANRNPRPPNRAWRQIQSASGSDPGSLPEPGEEPVDARTEASALRENRIDGGATTSEREGPSIGSRWMG